MSVEQTQTTMDRYFQAMSLDQDFSGFFADDVTWLMVDSGQQVKGSSAVRDYIVELHSKMTGQEQPHGLVVTDGHAYLEGDSVTSVGVESELSYCLVYDLDGERITAMRCYGTVAAIMAGDRSCDAPGESGR